MKLRILSVAMAGIAIPAIAAESLPQGFNEFMDDLGFAYDHCTSGRNLVRFNKDAMSEVSQKMYEIRVKANGGMPPFLTGPSPAPANADELANRCRSIRDNVGDYADSVLDVQGLVQP